MLTVDVRGYKILEMPTSLGSNSRLRAYQPSNYTVVAICSSHRFSVRTDSGPSYLCLCPLLSLGEVTGAPGAGENLPGSKFRKLQQGLTTLSPAWMSQASSL